MPFYAAAGQCEPDKGAQVGTIIVTYEDGNVSVTYDIFDGYVLKEAHLYVGCKQYAESKNGPTTAPGQYPFNLSWGDNYVQNYTFEGITATGGIYVIAHGETCRTTCTDCTELLDAVLADDNNGAYDFNTSIDCYNEANDRDGDGIEDPCDDYDNSIVDTNDFDTSQITRIPEIVTYPNPFKDELKVDYKYPYETNVKIQVFDTKGTLIYAIVDNNYIKGTRGSKLIQFYDKPSATYIIKVSSARETISKMVILHNH